MMAPAARRSQRDPGNAQIIARRFTPHSRCLLDSTQGPPKPSQRDHLFASLFAQDISHPTEANGPRQKTMSCPFRYGRFSGDPIWPVLGDPQGHQVARGQWVIAWADRDERIVHIGNELDAGPS